MRETRKVCYLLIVECGEFSLAVMSIVIGGSVQGLIPVLMSKFQKTANCFNNSIKMMMLIMTMIIFMLTLFQEGAT